MTPAKNPEKKSAKKEKVVTISDHDLWGKCLAKIKKEISDENYSTWFVPTRLHSITKDKLIKTVNGFAMVSEHVMRIAPGEPVLYHGTYDGTFVFYLRCLDEKLRQQVVMVRKLRLQPEQVSSEVGLQWLSDKSRRRQVEIAENQEWIAAELNRTGCNWLLLEEPSGKKHQVLAELLVTLAEIKKYELVEVFNVDMKSQTKRVMLYRIRATGLPSQDASKRLVPMQFEGRSCLPVSSR